MNFLDNILPSFLGGGKSRPTQVVAASASEDGMEARGMMPSTTMQVQDLNSVLTTSLTGSAALKVSAVYACMKVICDTIASVSRNYYDTNPVKDTRSKNKNNPTLPLLDRVNEYLSFSDFIYIYLKQKWIYGNSYWIISRDKFGTAIELHFRQNGQIRPYIENNELWYFDSVTGRSYDPLDILHFKDLTSSTNPYLGKSRIDEFASTIGKMKATDDLQNKVSSSGLSIGGLLLYDKEAQLDDAQVARMEANFNKNHAGVKNAGKWGFLNGISQVVQMNAVMTLSDAQILGMMGMAIEDICRMMSVPPSKIAHLVKATYNNVEHLAIDYVQSAILPEVTQFENEWDYKILGQYPNTRVKLELDSLMRADSVKSMEMIVKAVSFGILNRTEARAFLNRNPYPGSDKFLIQSNNLSTIDNNGNIEVPVINSKSPSPNKPQDGKE